MIDLRGYIENLKSVFDTSEEVRDKAIVDYIHEEVLPLINCKRIIAFNPICMILPIINIAQLLMIRNNKQLYIIYMLVVASVINIVVNTYQSIKIYDLIYSKRSRNIKLSNKLIRRHYMRYWACYGIMLNLTAIVRLILGLGPDFFLLISLNLNLVPIYTAKGYGKMCYGQTTMYIMMAIYMLIFDLKYKTTVHTIGTHIQIIISCFLVLYLGVAIQYHSVRMHVAENYIKFKAYVDPLTGMMTRIGGNVEIHDMMKERQGGTQIGVVMLDVDFFKKYNDKFGHVEGDKCLNRVASAAMSVMRVNCDVFIRHGGEEFVGIIFDVDEENTLKVGKRICDAVYDLKIEPGTKEIADYVTVSVGVSTKKVDSVFNYEDIILEADKALYYSKSHGRNRVTLYSQCANMIGQQD